MKIWCTLSRNPANRCRESCALWSSFPVGYPGNYLPVDSNLKTNYNSLSANDLFYY